MLITFEGIDGSGKTTQASLLAESLRAAGREVVFVREPGGTALGESVRAILLDPSGSVEPMAEVMLFSAARAQLVSEVIVPALRAGAVVIGDRFYDSTTAYQGGGRGLLEREWLEGLHDRVTGGLEPARTYLIDVPVAVALERRGGRAEDRMELAGAGFFEQVRVAYADLAARHPRRILLLDGTLPSDELHARILADTQDRLSAGDL